MSNKYSVNLFWFESTNFGDMLSPFLLKEFTGGNSDIVSVPQTSEEHKFIITGSVLSAENIRNAIVFGAGFICSNNYFTGKNVLIAGIRGNLSLDKIISERDKHGNEEIIICGDVVIGEPSLCLPVFYNPYAEKKYILGIIPHLFDYEKARQLYSHDPETIIIDLAQHPGESIEDCIKSIIFQIKQCEHIISSSLHGLIVAAAYGIPCEWCEFNRKSLLGDRFKFYDFLESIDHIIEGNEYVQPVDLTGSKVPVQVLLRDHRRFINKKISPWEIYEAGRVVCMRLAL